MGEVKFERLEIAKGPQIAEFEKVSKEQYNDNATYDNIKLPKRATKGSAGYDFFLPHDITINPGENVKVATGIRCFMDSGYVLQLYPRSGLGFKYGLQLRNTVGIIDSDYYYALNEGHIICSLVNTGDIPIELKAGDAFVQGVFMPYGITFDDEVTRVRTGGFGSTSE